MANQNEYVILETETSPNYRINRVNKVSLKYGTGDSYFTPATRISPKDFVNDSDWYEVNQSQSTPVYYVADNSVFLFPTPDENVTSGLKLEVILQPVDLTISSTEDEVVIPPRFHKVIIQGMRQRIYAGRQLLNEENIAMATYDKMKREMVSAMKARDQGVVQVVTGDLSNYC